MSSQTLAARVSDLIDHFRLDAQCHDSYTVITSPIPGRRNAKATQRWNRTKRIGQGAFGLVWLEEQEGIKALRAVKELQKDSVSRQETTTMYAHELYALAKFSKFTDHFADFYGWYETPGSLYLSMEYFPLGDLSRHMNCAFPEAEAREIISQLASGLEIIHSQNITHRDLKPQNIFVVEQSPNWWVKIGDFGVSKRFSETSALQTVVGTVLFMAPEIADDDDDDEETYTNAVDMWSLGCITYLLLCFQYPFDNTRDLRRYSRGKTSLRLKPLHDQNISSVGVDLIQRLLSSSSSDRPSASLVTQDKWLQRTTVNLESNSENIPDSADQAVSDLGLVLKSVSIESSSAMFNRTSKNEGIESPPELSEVAMQWQGYNPLKGSRSLRKANLKESIPEGMVLVRVITDETIRGYTGRGIFDPYSSNSQNAPAICYWAPPWTTIRNILTTLRENQDIKATVIRMWPFIRNDTHAKWELQQPCQNYDDSIVDPRSTPYNKSYFWAEPGDCWPPENNLYITGRWRLVFLKQYTNVAGSATTGMWSTYIDSSRSLDDVVSDLIRQTKINNSVFVFAEHNLYKRLLGYDKDYIGFGYQRPEDIPNGAIFCIEQHSLDYHIKSSNLGQRLSQIL